MHLHEPSLCKWTFQLNFCSLLPSMYHTNKRDTSEGFEQGGRIGQTEKSWACSVWDCAEICSWSWLDAADQLNLKPRGSFQFNLLLLKVPRNTVCGKEEARQDGNYVLYSFCLLVKGYTVKIKETKLSRSIFLPCSINWMVFPLKRRKGISYIKSLLIVIYIRQKHPHGPCEFSFLMSWIHRNSEKFTLTESKVCS